MTRGNVILRTFATLTACAALAGGCHSLVDGVAGGRCETDDETGPGWRDRADIFWIATNDDGSPADPCVDLYGSTCENSFDGTCTLDDICDAVAKQCRVADVEAEKECPAAIRDKLEPQNVEVAQLKVADVYYEFISNDPTCFRLELGLAGTDVGDGVLDDLLIVTDAHGFDDLDIDDDDVRIVDENEAGGPDLQIEVCLKEGTPQSFNQLAVQTFAEPELTSNRTCGYEASVPRREAIE